MTIQRFYVKASRLIFSRNMLNMISEFISFNPKLPRWRDRHLNFLSKDWLINILTWSSVTYLSTVETSGDNLGAVFGLEFWTLCQGILWCTKHFLPWVSLLLGSLTSPFLVLVDVGTKTVLDVKSNFIVAQPSLYTASLFSPNMLSSFIDRLEKVWSWALDLSSSITSLLTFFYKNSFTLQVDSSSLA